MLQNNQQIIEKIRKEIKICIEANENENTTSQNLWDTVKAVLRGRFVAIQAYLKTQEKSQINNLTLHLKQLEKEEMKNPRVSRRKEILRIRAEINAKETKKTIAKINKAKSCFFEKVNKKKKLEIEPPYDPAIPLLGIHTRETRSERDMCTPVFIAALFIIARTWKHQQTNG